MIHQRTGNSIVRHVRQQRLSRLCRINFYTAAYTLLTIAVGVQIVIVGRYTILGILAHCNLTEIVAATHGHFSALTCIEDTAFAGNTSLIFNLTDTGPSAEEKVVKTVGNRMCFVEGLNERNGTPVTDGGCPCKADWYGASCSVPGFIHRSKTPWSKDSLQLRSQPRRIIYAFPFHIEIDMAQLRFAELADVVDVYLILESNYTAFGKPKPLHLLERLRNGALSEVTGTVVHIFLNYFPATAYSDGWVADALHRNYLGTHGLRRLGGLRVDDLLVLTDADELPSRQVLSFLKWHDGYSEPVSFSYQWSVYGLFWGVPDVNGVIKTQHIPSAITVAMAIFVFRYQIYFIRNAPTFITQHAFDVKVV